MLKTILYLISVGALTGQLQRDVSLPTMVDDLVGNFDKLL